VRRIPFFLAATAALLPVVLTASAVPASAAGSSLTVTTIGRSGAKVSSGVYAINLANDGFHSLSTGKALSLPKGKYAVLSYIQAPTAPWTVTIAERVVSVSGHTAVTLDARQGKPVRVTVDGSTGAGNAASQVDAVACTSDYGSIGLVQAAPGSLYIVPSASKLLGYAYIANVQGAKDYIVSGASGTGIPSDPGGSFHSKSLAKVSLQVRANEYQSSQVTTSLYENPEGTAKAMCQFGLSQQIGSGSAPYTATAYVSPGPWRWQKAIGPDAYASTDTDESTDLHLVAGHSYSRIANRAVFAPWADYPDLCGRAVRFTPDSMIESPDQQTGPWDLGKVRETVQLTKAGKLVKKSGPSSGKSFSATIKSTGWYRLTADADRYAGGNALPAGLLSPRVNLSMYFHADPARSEVLPVFLSKLVPGGLNRYNHAAAGSSTPLTVTTSQSESASCESPVARTVKSVKVWASYDNGHSWHAVTVKRSGGTWTGTVHNPGSGQVSLRSQVSDPSGDNTTETVYAAYGIG
jgi:hypothetical protein